MPLDRDTLIFGINNTTNRYYGASLADQLDGEYLAKWTQPQFFFPLDWVLEHSKGPVDEAAYAVRYCDDSETLAAIARRERRLAVMKALASNPCLRADSFDDVIARTGDEHHRILHYLRTNAVDNAAVHQSPEEEIAELLAAERTYDTGVNSSRYVTVLERVAGLSGICPTLADQLLRREAALGKFAYASGYLEHYYVNPSEQRKTFSMVTLSPEEIVGLHNPSAQDALLSALLRNLEYAEEQIQPIDLGVVRAMATSIVDPPDTLDYDYAAREIFCSEGVDILIEVPGWHVFLERQIMSNDQFARLVESVDYEHVNALFSQLKGNREKLIALLAKVDKVSSYDDDASNALECLSGPDDELLATILDLSDDVTISNYIKGEYLVGANKETLLPALSEIPALVAKLVAEYPDAFDGFSYYIRYNRSSVNVSDEYIATLIECIPGLAFELRGDKTYSSDIYQMLMATGVREDDLLEAFSDANKMSLLNLKETLLAKAE